MAKALVALEPFMNHDAASLAKDRESVAPLFEAFLAAVESGVVRTATRDDKGTWHVDARVKQAILLGFRLGVLKDMSDGALSFIDKDTYPARRFSVDDRVRVVPGGSSVRRGAHVAAGVTIMPPAYINVGAFVDEGTMVDSHALVGSCAQIGKRVHISAAAQIGGVLEPVGALPVIVEDDALIGGNVGVYEGTIVRARAVLGAGVVLTGSTKVYDVVNETILGADGPLEIPEGAVVVPGARQMKGAFAEAHGLSIATPLIVKYRDQKTDARSALESALRG